MAMLQINLLGDLEVIRDDKVVELPPSRKTRALLAYLALNTRSFRRERLCELFWEIPDDPRGALRWSLSKLRRLVDAPGRPCIKADRLSVGFDGTGVAVDALMHRAVADGDLAGTGLSTLEAAATRYRGELLEGLDLPRLHDFHSWCLGERERAAQAQMKILSALITRLDPEPERALPHARDLVGMAPYDEPARARLIELLVELNKGDEAELQLQTGLRMLAEVGASSEGLLLQALRRRGRRRPHSGASPLTDTAAAMMDGAHRPASRSSAGAAVQTDDAASTAGGVPGAGHESDPASGATVATGAPSTELAAAERSAGAVTTDRRPTMPDTQATTSAAPVSRTGAALVGRNDELARLTDSFAQVVAQRRARFMLITGEPGIGKSSLLTARRQHVRGNDACLLETSAYESDMLRPFALWIDAFRRRPEPGPALFDDSNFDNRNRLFAMLSERIAKHCAQRPVVLLFDDLQWCDESSAAALHYLARVHRDAPLLGVLAARDAELDDNDAVQPTLRGLRHDGLLDEMRLAPLPDAAARELIDAHAPEADSERLSRESGGNPLLAIELARAERAGARGGSLDELVRERLTRFSADGVELLRWAAVLSPRIDLPVLMQVTGFNTNRIGELLAAAERQAMLQSGDRGFRFLHDLIAHGVYVDIPLARRRAMHHRVAEILQQDTALDLGRAAELAHHAQQSGDPGLAARALIAAGRLCLRFFANGDAQSLSRQGLTLAGELSDVERVSLSLELHEILLSATAVDDWEGAARDLVALAEEALDHGALAHARLGYHLASDLRWQHGAWNRAQEESLQAERVVRSASDADHIVGMAETARCLALLERDLSHSDALLMEAQALALRTRISHHAIPLGLGILRFHENRLDDAEALFNEARTLCKAAGDRLSEFQADEYLLLIAFERAQFAAARTRATALLRLGEKLRDGSEAPYAQALAALCDYATGGNADALLHAMEALRAADAKHRLANVAIRAALIDLAADRPASARRHAEETLNCAQLLERCTEMLLAHCVLARAADSDGNRDAATAHREAATALQNAPVAGWAKRRAQALLATAEETFRT